MAAVLAVRTQLAWRHQTDLLKRSNLGVKSCHPMSCCCLPCGIMFMRTSLCLLLCGLLIRHETL